MLEELIKRRREYLQCRINDIAPLWDRKIEEGDTLPLLCKLDCGENILTLEAKCFIWKIFNNQNKLNVLCHISKSKFLIKFDKKWDMVYTRNLLRDAEIFKQHQSALFVDQPVDNYPLEEQYNLLFIENITPFQPLVDWSIEKGKAKVKLVNYNNDEHYYIAEKRFIKLCKDYSISIKRVEYAPELIVFEVDIENKNQVRILANNESVFSIEKMPIIVQE